MKCIIFGGRDFNDQVYMFNILDQLQNNMAQPITTVISGKARGADTIGERWAISRNIPIIGKAADWNTHGKRAGWIRNCEMADIADYGVGFNGGRGTEMMFTILTQRNIPFFDARY